jgi:hypothetical protein
MRLVTIAQSLNQCYLWGLYILLPAVIRKCGHELSFRTHTHTHTKSYSFTGDSQNLASDTERGSTVIWIFRWSAAVTQTQHWQRIGWIKFMAAVKPQCQNNSKHGLYSSFLQAKSTCEIAYSYGCVISNLFCIVGYRGQITYTNRPHTVNGAYLSIFKSLHKNSRWSSLGRRM